MSRLVVTARLTEENERHLFMFCRIAWFDLVTFNGFFQRNSNESKIKINQNDSNRLFVLVHPKLRKRLASHRLLCPVQRRLTCSLSSRRSVLGVHRPLGAWLEVVITPTRTRCGCGSSLTDLYLVSIRYFMCLPVRVWRDEEVDRHISPSGHQPVR